MRRLGDAAEVRGRCGSAISDLGVEMSLFGDIDIDIGAACLGVVT